jgi:hypothetical protein
LSDANQRSAPRSITAMSTPPFYRALFGKVGTTVVPISFIVEGNEYIAELTAVTKSGWPKQT